MKASHIYTKIKNLMVTKPSDNKNSYKIIVIYNV